VKVLWDEGLRPKLVTGSSSGAIVAACLASGMRPAELEKELLNLTQEQYWDPKFGFGFLKGERFEQTLCSFVTPKMEHAQIPIQISCFNIKKRKTEIFEQGPFAKIVRASCRALRRFPNQHILQVAGLPFTGPKHFSNAPKAIALAYEETKKLLEREA
jgi:NTE family protein